MKTEAEWKKFHPVFLGKTPKTVIKNIQNDAYNQCLLDLMADDLLPDKKKSLDKFRKIVT